MGRFKFVIILVLLSMLTGCAFAPVTRPDLNIYNPIKQRSYSTDRVTSIALVQKALANMGYQVASANVSTSEIISSSRLIQSVGKADCGTWNAGPVTGQVTSIMKVKVVEEANQSLVILDHHITTLFTGKNLYGMTTRQEHYRCASKGDTERLFFNEMDNLTK